MCSLTHFILLRNNWLFSIVFETTLKNCGVFPTVLHCTKTTLIVAKEMNQILCCWPYLDLFSARTALTPRRTRSNWNGTWESTQARNPTSATSATPDSPSQTHWRLTGWFTPVTNLSSRYTHYWRCYILFMVSLYSKILFWNWKVTRTLPIALHRLFCVHNPFITTSKKAGLFWDI